MYAHAVFDFAFAEVVQVRLPVRILFQIFGNVVGNQDVSRHRRQWFLPAKQKVGPSVIPMSSPR